MSYGTIFRLLVTATAGVTEPNSMWANGCTDSANGPCRSTCGATRARCGTAAPAAATRRASTPFTSPSLSTSARSEEHTSELQSRRDLVCRLLLEKKKKEALHSSKSGKPLQLKLLINCISKKSAYPLPFSTSKRPRKRWACARLLFILSQ